jgi:hypothetical protein
MQATLYFDDVLSEFGSDLNSFKHKKQTTDNSRPAKTRSKSDIFSTLDQRLLKLYRAIDMAG